MTKLKFESLTDEQKALLLDYAYGTVNRISALKARRLVSTNYVAREFYLENKKIAEAVRSIKEKQLSEKVEERILKNISVLAEKEIDLKKELKFRQLNVGFAGAVVTVVVALIVALLVNFTSPKRQYSYSEIREANKEVLESLAIVARTFKKTEIFVTNDVVANRLLQPFKKSKSLVNNLFEVKK